MLSANVIRSVPGDAAGCDVCPSKVKQMPMRMRNVSWVNFSILLLKGRELDKQKPARLAYVLLDWFQAG
jgi:hypothetical protein